MITMTESEALSGLLLDHITTAVLLYDNDFRLVDMNAAAEDLLSVSQRQVAGMDAWQMMSKSKQFSDSLQRSVSSGASYAQWAMDVTLINKKVITVDCVFTPIRIQNNSQHLLVEMINTDFHKRIAREENLIAQNLTSKELGKALAHEIKNPLGGLRGAAQLLSQELIEDDLKEYTDIIISEADRLRNLVDRMLAPEKELNYSVENIHEILQYVCHLIAAETNTEFSLICDYDPSLPEITADRGSLVQVFLNIIRNAIQAIDDDGEVIIKTRAERKVTIAQTMHKLCLRVDVIDNGPGVDDSLVDRIFYPMITTRASGTGLGLSIAQSLIQKHGGIIEYNRINQKTIFTILFPWDHNHA